MTQCLFYFQNLCAHMLWKILKRNWTWSFWVHINIFIYNSLKSINWVVKWSCLEIQCHIDYHIDARYWKESIFFINKPKSYNNNIHIEKEALEPHCKKCVLFVQYTCTMLYWFGVTWSTIVFLLNLIFYDLSIFYFTIFVKHFVTWNLKKCYTK